MFETMYDARGIAWRLQVDVAKQIIVMDLSEDKSEPGYSSTRRYGWTETWKPCRKAARRYRLLRRREAYQHRRITAKDRNGEEFVLKPKACWPWSSMKWIT